MDEQIQNAFIEIFIYRRPRGRKRLSASSGHHSGAFMYTAYRCELPWSLALMEYSDRGLINGSRFNKRLKLSGRSRSSDPLNDHLSLLHLTPSGCGVGLVTELCRSSERFKLATGDQRDDEA